MMQLLCNGQAVDLSAGTEIQLKDSNSLFAFDNLQCERTTEFSLPATPTNDRLFALARRPDMPGQAMRVKFDAELYIGVIVKYGYLYVSEWTGESYKAIFVTGDFIGLQAIRDLGHLTQIVNLSETVRAGQNVKFCGETMENVLFDNYRYVYREPTGDYEQEHPSYCRPSVGVKPLVQRICQQNGLTAPTLPEAARYLRIIPPCAYLPRGLFALQCQLIANPYAPTEFPPANINTLPQYQTALFTTERCSPSVVWNKNVTQITADTYYDVLQFKCLVDMDIEFPRDFPETAYLYDFSGARANLGDEWGNFFGERMFTKAENATDVVRSGYALGGRVISLHAGDAFSFVDERMYVNTLVGDIQNKGFILHTNTLFNTNYSLTVNSQNEGDADVGQVVRAQDCLPDITFVELLKTIAAATGTVLQFRNGIISFDALNVTGYTSVDVSQQVVERGAVSRGFNKYAQHNIVKFDSGDRIKDPETIEYTISNVNLQEDKVLQVIPFSEADDAKFLQVIDEFLFDEPANGVLYVTGFDDKFILAGCGEYYVEPDPEEPDSGGWFLHHYLTRVIPQKNEHMQAICDASTEVTVKIRMPIHAYTQLMSRRRILLDGLQYVWTEKLWQKDEARLKLARII